MSISSPLEGRHQRRHRFIPPAGRFSASPCRARRLDYTRPGFDDDPAVLVASDVDPLLGADPRFVRRVCCGEGGGDVLEAGNEGFDACRADVTLTGSRIPAPSSVLEPATFTVDGATELVIWLGEVDGCVHDDGVRWKAT